MNAYEPDEVALIDALRHEFGDEAFRSTIAQTSRRKAVPR